MEDFFVDKVTFSETPAVGPAIKVFASPENREVKPFVVRKELYPPFKDRVTVGLKRKPGLMNWNKAMLFRIFIPLAESKS